VDDLQHCCWLLFVLDFVHDYLEYSNRFEVCIFSLMGLLLGVWLTFMKVLRVVSLRCFWLPKSNPLLDREQYRQK
jgi:hypothetical protein